MPGPDERASVGRASARLGRTCGLADPAGRLRYVSGKRAAAVARLGIETVGDLLLHVPRRYLDFSRVTSIGFADVGSEVTVVARVDSVVRKRPRPRLDIVEVSVVDDTGVMRAVFFRQPWVADQIREGDVVALSGKVTFSYGFKEMNSPFHEVLGAGEDAGRLSRVLPVHGVGEGLSVSWMRRIASAAVADQSDVCDFLPAPLVAARGLMTRGRALAQVHFPHDLAAAEEARRRLAYDELLCLQLALHARRRIQLAGVEPVSHVVDGERLAALRRALPFALTSEQESCVTQILADMGSARVMNRLLLGDVGTGKTAVAAFGLAACADTGTQAAMMAPTSVLAAQYAEKLGPLLDAAGVGWVLLTGATPAAARRDAVARLASGEATVAFGTTAVLSPDVRFRRLSLVVVDEQHRFGVDQRTALRRKSAGADMLSMTATPIPRTLALSLYGDLDRSTIRHRPNPGAGVSTRVIAPESLDLAWGAIRDAVAEGRQAYVVCPLIDDGDAGADQADDAPEPDEAAPRPHSAAAMAEELRGRVLRGMRVGLLTGRMPAAEKDAAMAAFRDRETQVLVSTTVVEVGVDVPNATVMLVMDADRFGLATLHQIRGRVGRGDHAGEVFLETSSKRGTPARRRLEAVESTTDGEELAELDLRLRHEGEVLGYRQHGGATLRLVDPAVDADLAEAAQADAAAIAAADPALAEPAHVPLALEVQGRFGAWFEEAGRA